MDRGACWATVHRVIESQTRMKPLSTAHSMYIINNTYEKRSEKEYTCSSRSPSPRLGKKTP